MNILKYPVLSGMVAGSAVLLFNIFFPLIGSMFFPGESGMILIYPVAIVNLPVIGYRHYYEAFSFLICFHPVVLMFFLSPVFYFSCAYLVVFVLNNNRMDRQYYYRILLFSAIIMFILIGSFFGKTIVKKYAIKHVSNPKYSDIIFRTNSREDVLEIIEELQKMPEDNFDSMRAKNQMIQFLQNKEAKEAIPMLLGFIKKSHKFVAEKSIEAVGAIDGPDEAVPIIVQYIKNNNYKISHFPAGWTFSKYNVNPELTDALIKVCENMKDDDFKIGQALLALSFVADHETLVKLQEQYSDKLNKFENYNAREEIKRQIQKKKPISFQKNKQDSAAYA